MRVRGFSFEPAGLEAFVQVAWDLRADDPGWVPPIRDSLRAHLSQDNPFFRHGRIRNFLALREGRAVGRCSAIIDERLLDDGRTVGMIGHFEVEEAEATASALLDQAVRWLDEQGISVVWGPMDFSIFNGYRFKTGGFDRAPFLGEPDNPPEYPGHFVRYGFDPFQAYTAWDLDEEQVRAVQEGAAAAAARKEVARHGYSYRPFDVERFDEELRTLHHLTVECFEAHLGYVPISYDEFAFWFRGARLLMDPAITLLFVGPDGRVVGASYKYPDWAPVMRRLDGELDPEGLGALRREVELDRAVYHTDMVRPGHRRRGVIQGSYTRFIEAARSRGYTRAVTGLALAGNPIWAKVLDVAEPSREYALYRLEL